MQNSDLMYRLTLAQGLLNEAHRLMTLSLTMSGPGAELLAKQQYSEAGRMLVEGTNMMVGLMSSFGTLDAVDKMLKMWRKAN